MRVFGGQRRATCMPRGPRWRDRPSFSTFGGASDNGLPATQRPSQLDWGWPRGARPAGGDMFGIAFPPGRGAPCRLSPSPVRGPRRSHRRASRDHLGVTLARLGGLCLAATGPPKVPRGRLGTSWGCPGALQSPRDCSGKCQGCCLGSFGFPEAPTGHSIQEPCGMQGVLHTKRDDVAL